MALLFFPLIAFLAVLLTVLLLHRVWVGLFDPRSKAKNHRLQAIHNTVHRAGKGPGGVQNTVREGAGESWLRSHFKAFSQLEALIRRAHSPLCALQVLAMTLGLFALVGVPGMLMGINALFILVPAAAIASTPVLWLSRAANRRRRAFGDKLPEALDYISRSMRAGHSLTSAIGMLGTEFRDPIGHEFKTVFDEIGFGIPFKDAIGELADRVQSTDLNFFVISLQIQHETGGNLTELLDGLSNTIRQRIKLRGKIRTLSSEGRASAWVLGSMPFALVAILTLINPGYISVLWTTPEGHKLTLSALGLMSVGFFLLKRIVNFKV
ncbi:type II secretion system F family protein [Pelodictyon luteolum]|uniref:TadB protein n=1 Tax=Chlorobium luteolum (strain DSM 273 / BCRC 81028 / 2530) TaxID=319225 RepID=Q3B4R5_CHLL3|nr:type II secretion system F family protein [Pelodictyon luteolum]ABB23666.1 TadB protein [Pelodictyon luteolum DSM 273]